MPTRPPPILNSQEEKPIDDEMQPYIRLLGEIVMRAILDYLDDVPLTLSYQTRRKKRDTSSAWAFFFGEKSDDADVPFTFAWISMHLAERPDDFMAAVRTFLLNAPKRAASVGEKGKYWLQYLQ